MTGWHVPVGDGCEVESCPDWRHVTDPRLVAQVQMEVGAFLFSGEWDHLSVPEARVEADKITKAVLARERTTDESQCVWRGTDRPFTLLV